MPVDAVIDESAQDETLTQAEIALRERLTLLAKDFFLKQGYTSSTMDQVAKTAKVSKKTVYRLFRTKEAVLRAVVHSIMQEIEAVTTPVYEQYDRSFAVRFEQLVVDITPQYAQLRSAASLREMRNVAPDMYEEFDAWRRKRFAITTRMLKEARESGQISTEFDFDELVSIYAALHNSCMDHAITHQPDISADEMYRAFVDVLLNGILSREPVK